MPGQPRRRRTDRLYPPRELTPRLLDAVRAVNEAPGITVEELAAALGVGMARVWQLVERLEYDGRIHRVGTPYTTRERSKAL